LGSSRRSYALKGDETIEQLKAKYELLQAKILEVKREQRRKRDEMELNDLKLDLNIKIVEFGVLTRDMNIAVRQRVARHILHQRAADRHRKRGAKVLYCC
jgi:hypothetical protein